MKTKFRQYLTVLVTALMVVGTVGACGDDSDTDSTPSDGTTETRSVLEVAEANGQFGTLLSAVDAAGLTDTLSAAGPYTVFAPTDDAFAALPAGTLDALLADPTALSAVLTYHVVSGELPAASVVTQTALDTLNGASVAVEVSGSTVKIGGATVVVADVRAANGIIHVIDTVLTPPPAADPEPGTIPEVAAAAGNFTTLLAAVKAADLADTLAGEGPFTVFAPTDEAFAALPAGTLDALLADKPALTQVLLHHVFSGSASAEDVQAATSFTMLSGQDVAVEIKDGKVWIGEAQILTTDIKTSNGIIHVIDAVLIPAPETNQPGNLVEVAAAAGNFTTLLAAAKAAGLDAALSGEGPYTIFAPTDDAFAALPAGALDALLADIPALTNVLLYHAVAAKLTAADVTAKTELTTMAGLPVPITMENGKVWIGGAQILTTDIEASNGIIHVIDAVLLP
ncbi:MAG: fasciclin domain-containing protein [Myxococcales bacterium]|nr:fasciclin domain-containing protein [Myxococcales bacterium]